MGNTAPYLKKMENAQRLFIFHRSVVQHGYVDDMHGSWKLRTRIDHSSVNLPHRTAETAKHVYPLFGRSMHSHLPQGTDMISLMQLELGGTWALTRVMIITICYVVTSSNVNTFRQNSKFVHNSGRATHIRILLHHDELSDPQVLTLTVKREAHPFERWAGKSRPWKAEPMLGFTFLRHLS